MSPARPRLETEPCTEEAEGWTQSTIRGLWGLKVSAQPSSQGSSGAEDVAAPFHRQDSAAQRAGVTQPVGPRRELTPSHCLRLCQEGQAGLSHPAPQGTRPGVFPGPPILRTGRLGWQSQETRTRAGDGGQFTGHVSAFRGDCRGHTELRTKPVGDPDCGTLLGTQHQSHTSSYRHFHFHKL